jgi:hypothetical protein
MHREAEAAAPPAGLGAPALPGEALLLAAGALRVSGRPLMSAGEGGRGSACADPR